MNLPEYFTQQCWQGLKNRGLDQREEYRQQLQTELDLIINLDFPGYFLIVQDIIRWARSQNIAVGPGRGSAAGCLCAYCLEITDVDPLKFRLYFERFLNPSRVSPPDIDMDFAKSRREEILEYLQERYGKDHVVQIATFNKIFAKQAIRDIGRVMDVPFKTVDDLAKLVPPPIKGKQPKLAQAYATTPELKKIREQDDETAPGRQILTIAEKIEGLEKSLSIHAAGVIISDVPLIDHLPLASSKGTTVTQFDMKDLEELGFIKFDVLALKNLDVISDCVQLIKEQHGLELDWRHLPESEDEHPEVFDYLREGHFGGIFQLEATSGMRELILDLQPRNIEDLSIAVAIFRPGPLQSGMKDHYLAVRQGREQPEYLVEELRPILEVTLGQLIYQEQVLEICKQLAGFSLAEADLIRRAMGKKIAKEMESRHEQFLVGMKSNGFTEEVAEELWSRIATHAGYSFNKTISEEAWVLRANNGHFTDSTWMQIKELAAKWNEQDAQGNYTSTAKKLRAKKLQLIQMDEDGYCRPGHLIDLHDHGIKPVYEIITESGYVSPPVSRNHRLMTTDGYKTINTGLSINDSLLFMDKNKGCQTEQAKGERVKRWSRGYPTFEDKITEIRYVGEHHCYDLEMDTEGHNYVASADPEKYPPVISHNSHSVAYAFITYITAYLKTHYRLEFYTALLNNTKDATERDKFFSYLLEIREAGYRLLPPDINRSQVDFSIDNGAIRYGLSGVRNVGEQVARHLVLRRQAHAGGFANLRDLVETVDSSQVNIKVLEALAFSGCLDGFADNRRTLAENCRSFLQAVRKLNTRVPAIENKYHNTVERAVEIAERQPAKHGGDKLAEKLRKAEAKRQQERQSLDAEYEKILSSLDEKEPYTTRELLRLEKEYLGFYLSGHPLDHYHAEIRKRQALLVSELGFQQSSAVRVAGAISNLKEKMTQKKQLMYTFLLEDALGAVECICFPTSAALLQGQLQNDACVIVVGQIRHRQKNEESENLELIVFQVELLDAPPPPPETLRLMVELRQLNQEYYQQLLQILREHPGDQPLQIVSVPSLGVALAASSMKVRYDDSIREELKKLIGVSCQSIPTLGEEIV